MSRRSPNARMSRSIKEIRSNETVAVVLACLQYHVSTSRGVIRNVTRCDETRAQLSVIEQIQSIECRDKRDSKTETERRPRTDELMAD